MSMRENTSDKLPSLAEAQIKKIYKITKITLKMPRIKLYNKFSRLLNKYFKYV